MPCWPSRRKTRAIAVIDGPNTNDEAAIDYRSLFGSDRAYIVDPWFCRCATRMGRRNRSRRQPEWPG